MPLETDLLDVRLLIARGELDQAERLLAEAVERDPRDLGALMLQGAVLLQQRELSGALAVYERAVALAPDSAEALNGCARCCLALERDGEALEHAFAARDRLALGDNFVQAGPVYLSIVLSLRRQRRYREALKLAEEGLSRSGDAVLARWAGTVEEELAEAQKERC